MSYVIALDGTDASGKKTQTELLSIYLKDIGYHVRKISFPDYDDDSSMLVRMYLNGAFGSHPDDTNAYAASIFFAADRYASFVRKWKEDYTSENCIILLDRYTSSNAIHQLSKIEEEQEKNDFLTWLYDLEFNKLVLPVPDMTLFLEMPPEVSLKLLQKRCEQNHITKDIHEADDEFLKKSYQAALFASEKWGWTNILCTDGEEPLTVAEIHEKIRRIVLESLPEKLKRSVI